MRDYEYHQDSCASKAVLYIQFKNEPFLHRNDFVGASIKILHVPFLIYAFRYRVDGLDSCCQASQSYWSVSFCESRCY